MPNNNPKSSTSRHGMWQNKGTFILAAAGSAVGLGNIWKFPYIVGENGGSAFIIIYLLSIVLIGVPIMMAEITLGREGRFSPINTMQKLVDYAKAHKAWTLIGWGGVLTGFLILSYYEVISGWALHYATEYGSHALGLKPVSEAMSAQDHWDNFQASPLKLILFQTLFVILTVVVISKGVNEGLEKAIVWLMSALFLLLLVLLFYSMFAGAFAQSVNYMFNPDWSKLGVRSVITALGHAFFTLSLGMGAIMAYGSYLPEDVHIPSTVILIALLDTVVAIVAGLVIFAIVFANPALEPGAGPGLLFITLSSAFMGGMPGGIFFGTLFFILVGVAALTSLISLTEPAIAWVVEKYNVSRARIAITIGVVAWILGLGTVFSFNLWSDFHLIGNQTFFDVIDAATSNIMLPLGGLFTALFIGWVMPKEQIFKQLSLSELGFKAWQIVIRWVAPIGVAIVFLYTYISAS